MPMLLKQGTSNAYPHLKCQPHVLQAWIAVFGASQLIVSQLPDISALKVRKPLNVIATSQSSWPRGWVMLARTVAC